MSGAVERTMDSAAEAQQAIASDPRRSAWASANAGSGKTTVLANRVVRLLLAGTDPARILCLTFTKAAAGEMANRVYRILSDWTSKTDADLDAAIARLEGEAPSGSAAPALRLAARRLYARVLDTPGGLKVQTIHGFCEGLLHAFPLEANVPGTFEVMDETVQAGLLAQVRDEMLGHIHRNPHTPVARSFAAIADISTDNAFDRLLAAIIDERDGLAAWLAAQGGPDEAVASAARFFEVPDDADVATLSRDIVDASLLTAEDWRGLADTCSADGGKTALAIAEGIQGWLAATDPVQRLQHLSALLLKQDGAPYAWASRITNAVEGARPGTRERMQAEAERLVAGRERLALFQALANTRHALVIADDLLARFRTVKRRSGALDYDDLISRTVDLLTRREARDWVLYKLDQGLDHVLLDEAQDTSPAQWKVVEQLVGDFFAGENARAARGGVRRTVFAVGDEKQSIYSFNGARPELFDIMRKRFQAKAEAAEAGSFAQAKMLVSFRSTADVLDAVDATFADPVAHEGLQSSNDAPSHAAYRTGEPGEVQVWSLLGAEAGAEPQEWWETVEQATNRQQAVVLAREMATRIAAWIADKEMLAARDRPIEPGDILVLVRSRDAFAAALTRGLKERDVEVAGTDRLALTDHIAVQDLLALGRVMVNLEDDLSLAALMKSPLLELTEDDVFDLSRARLDASPQISLHAALCEAGETVERYGLACERLDRWFGWAASEPVFEFFARVLGSDGGRARLYARLGLQAQDVIDALMAQALAHENESVPGLAAFLERMEGAPPVIKRELSQARGAVRIMTVHAAKGLEAPVVLLVDRSSAAHRSQNLPSLRAFGDPEAGPAAHGWLWVPSKDHEIEATRGATDEARKRDEDEHRRLLYVGMTRAEDRLVVCGYRGRADPPAHGWHELVSNGLQGDWEALDSADGDGEMKRWRWRSPKRVADRDRKAERTSIEPPPAAASPGWFGHQVARPASLPRPLSPSGAQALIDDRAALAPAAASLLEEPETGISASGFAGMDPRRRGTLMHTLLQWLPERAAAERETLAGQWLSRAAADRPKSERDAMLAATLAVLDDPALSQAFDPATSRAEASVMGHVTLNGKEQMIAGSIDRLSIADDSVTMLDYKTGARVPDDASKVGPDYVLQMALYRALLSQIYPGREGRCALVYTQAPEGPRTIWLPDRAMDEAMERLALALG